MENVKIAYRIDRATALREGSTTYGNGDYEPSVEELAELTPAERDWVARQTNPLPIQSMAAGWTTLRAAIQEAAAAPVREREAQIARLLAEGADGVYYWHGGVAHLGNLHDDPRIVAARERHASEAHERKVAAFCRRTPDTERVVCPGDARDVYPHTRLPSPAAEIADDPRVVAQLAAWETAGREEEARLITAELARVAGIQAFQGAAREFVIANVPDYARAAREGADVAVQAIRAAKLTIAEELDHLPEVYDTKPLGVPHAAAYVELDRVNAILESFLSDHPLIREISAELVRADTCPESGCSAGWRSCVEVTVTWGNGETVEFHTYADPASPHVHEGREDED